MSANDPLADARPVGEEIEFAEVRVATIDGQRSALMRRAWLRWLLLFVPSMALISLAMVWLDFSIVMTILLVMLVGVLLYQRHVNRRSWRSIMWGVHAKGE